MSQSTTASARAARAAKTQLDLLDDEPPAPSPAEAPAPKRRATAEQMAKGQREISVSEFFSKNRHLLGFDSPTKALLTAVKEAVDNSLDACEEAGILPDLLVEVRAVAGYEDRFVICVEDNGPGIVKAQVPKVFGKLLYGSKFHRLKQSRGQQGIGISAAAMYGQLTTGKPVKVFTKTGRGRMGYACDVGINTKTNSPDVSNEHDVELAKDHGTRVEIELQADYGRGQRHLLRYVEATVLANPHLSLRFVRPAEKPLSFPRAAAVPPKEAVEIKPHPHGVELGQLMRLAGDSASRDVKGFLQTAFSRVTGSVADDILKAAGLKERLKPRVLAEDRDLAEKLRKGILATKIMAPPTNCLSPIGDELLKKGLVSFLSVVQSELDEHPELDLLGEARAKGRRRKGEDPEAALLEEAKQKEAARPPEEGEEIIGGKKFFITTVTRPPKVYRGNPFQVEVGLAYGGDWPADKPIEVLRFANRVPLLFQKGACGVTEAVLRTDWRNYELQQPRGALPIGPMVLIVHIASVWVPFTSESKEAVAHYPELLGELRLAVQDCGRRLAAFIRKRRGAQWELKRRSIFELYIEELSRSLHELTGKSRDDFKRRLTDMAKDFTGGDETDAVIEGRDLVAAPRKKQPRAEAEE